MVQACGTGGWSGPQPGDPDNNVTLTATPAFGGIDIEFTYPGINPHAVAHTILYRSTSGTDDSPVRHAVFSGNFFYDKTTSATPIEYFYWIEIVSIHGTVGERIGPVSAIARPTITQVIEGLTAEIDASHLAQSLQEEIDRIDTNNLLITQEVLDRAASDDGLAASINLIEAYSDETRAIALEESIARADADSALVSQVNTVQTQLGDDIASVQTNLTSEIDYINGDLATIGAKFTVKTDVNGLIGGFGTYNDGSIVEAGFDVDRFWVGRTNEDKRKPFIIENGETFINEAVINKLTFNKLRAEDGSLIVENGKIKADFIRAKWAEIEGVSIGTADIQTAAITAAKIADGNITNAKIGTAAITNAKIGTAAVDTLELAGQAVTIPAATFYSGTSGIAEVTWTTVRSLSINTGGAPVQIMCGFTFYGYESRYENDSQVIVKARLLRGGTVVANYDTVGFASDDGDALSNNYSRAYAQGTFAAGYQYGGSTTTETFHLQIYMDSNSNNATRQCSNRFIQALVVKR